MKRKLFLTLTALVAAVVVTLDAQAWGGVGHSAIAYIAEQHLTPKAKEMCYRYLDNHSLAYYASWQDAWRFIPPYQETTYWHTSQVDANNEPINNNNGRRAAYFHVDSLRKDLKNYANQPDSMVAVNLKLMIHMVGDMHCPCHISYPDQNVKGGSIYRSGKKTKFHTFWDAAPSYMHKGWTCEDFHRNLDKLSKKKIAKMSKGSAADWLRESGADMREAYTLIPRHSEYTTLPKETRDRAVEICDLQILRGAYRLAYVLNEIFK